MIPVVRVHHDGAEDLIHAGALPAMRDAHVGWAAVQAMVEHPLLGQPVDDMRQPTASAVKRSVEDAYLGSWRRRTRSPG